MYRTTDRLLDKARTGLWLAGLWLYGYAVDRERTRATGRSQTGW